MKTFVALPLITEKSIASTANGIYTFVVPTWVEKSQIAAFVERHFSVTVTNVTTSTMRGNNVRFKQRSGKQSTYKKASVRLKKGDSIESFSLPVESTETPSNAPAQSEGTVVTDSKITVRSKSKKTAAKTEDK